MASSSNVSGNLVDELEEAFQSCIHALTKEESATGIDKDEIKVEVDQTTLKFIDLARQMEAFFLQKRFLLSALKPDLLLKEENFDLKQEIGRKDELIRKHYEKIESWKQLLSDQQNFNKPIQSMPPDMRGNLAGGAPGAPAALMASGGMNLPMQVSKTGAGPNLQGPLAYLEKTASNIGEPTVRIGPTAIVRCGTSSGWASAMVEGDAGGAGDAVEVEAEEEVGDVAVWPSSTVAH
uniref:Mediator of RNA polymerase II transcription subunit 28 n=1 Tax=Anopheles maculatus TaxID=74869 RepID=A0A182TB75_9DIPT